MKELFQLELFETILPETNVKHLKWSKATRNKSDSSKHGQLRVPETHRQMYQLYWQFWKTLTNLGKKNLSNSVPV